MLLLKLFLPLGSLYLHSYFEKGTDFIQVFPLHGGKIKNGNSMNLRDFPFQIGKSAYNLWDIREVQFPFVSLGGFVCQFVPQTEGKGLSYKGSF